MKFADARPAPKWSGVILDEIQHPIVLAPLAGGASTPELTAAVSEAGGVRFLVSRCLAVQALEGCIARVRELTDAPFGVNLFVPGDPNAPTPGLADYLRRIAQEASHNGEEAAGGAREQQRGAGGARDTPPLR